MIACVFNEKSIRKDKQDKPRHLHVLKCEIKNHCLTSEIDNLILGVIDTIHNYTRLVIVAPITLYNHTACAIPGSISSL